MTPHYSADGQACSAVQFYALACDPARSVVVEACAGAGKTWLLVSRILRALLAGAQPQEILAITFTRKSAGEMRHRLQEWLDLFGRGTAEQRVEALVQRGCSIAQAQALAPRLEHLQERVLASGRAVSIDTFHAWFSRLMRAAPRELLDRLGLQPGMALIEDTSELLPALMQRFHRAVARSDAPRADFAALVQTHGRHRVAAWLAATLQRRVEIELADPAGALANAVPDAAALWPVCAGLDDPAQRLHTDAALRSLLARLAKLLAAHSNKRPREAGMALREALDLADSYAAYAAARTALYTDKGDGGPRALGDSASFTEGIAALDELAQQRAQQQAHVDHGRMLRLTRVLLEQWRALKCARALADMNDLERCALALLGDPAMSDWVAQRLDARIRHVLIDEFQDTSPVQWHALAGWLSAYAGAGGGSSGQQPPSVFIVGDPKQSIYRFRRAEPRVFEAAREFVAMALSGVVLACDHTRRNAPAVVEVLNNVFGIACDQGDYPGFRPHSTSAAPAELPALRCLPEVPRPPSSRNAKVSTAPWRDSLLARRAEPEAVRRAEEAGHVARAIASLMREQGVALAEVMVLARKHSTLALVAQALRQLDIPCVAAEATRLADVPEATDLIAVLDVLASPGHDLALAQALKSPLFGADDAALLALAERADQAGRRGWWRALIGWADAPPPLDRARRLFTAWAQAAPQLPPHDLLDRIVHDSDALGRMVAAARPERRGLARLALQSLLAQALALGAGRYATPYNFVRALRQSSLTLPALASIDAVRLLTVHGAKGLEADVVCLLDTAPEPVQRHDPGLVIDWPVDEPVPRGVAFVARLDAVPPSLQALADEEAALVEREALNLLYVALTRARHALVVSQTEPRVSPPGPSWWRRLRPFGVDWVPPQTGPRPAGAADTVWLPSLPPAQPHDRVASSRLDVTSADDPVSARLGQALHRWLEWASAGTPLADPAQAAAQAGAEFGCTAEQSTEVRVLGQRILGSPSLKPFFDHDALAWAGNEVPVAINGQCGRIDRLVQLRADACWWVLDFKLNHRPQAWSELRQQLAQYAAAVAAQLPGATVRAAFITAEGRLLEVEWSRDAAQDAVQPMN